MSATEVPPSDTRIRAARASVPNRRRTLLIVTRDPIAARVIAFEARALQWTARVATTIKVALEVSTEPPDALIVGAELTDGSGFEIIGALRAVSPDLPALIVTKAARREDINRAHATRVLHVCSPYDAGTIEGFLHDCEEGTARDSSLTIEVAQLVERHRLAPSHADLLLAAAAETSTLKVLAERLGKSPSTVRTQAREIYQRLGEAGFEDVVAGVRLRAFQRR